VIRRGFSLVLGWALVATACAGEAEPATTQPPADPTGIAWELESGKVDGVEMSVLDSHPITLAFTVDEVRGTAACNGYGAGYTISGSEISLTGLGATEMACIPEEVMESEARYLDALLRVSGFTSTEDTLTLTGDAVELVFAALPPVPTAELTGTVWVLESLIEGDSASSAAGERATLELFTDGSMLGSTGCRALHGRYAVFGAEVTMPEMAAEGECPADLQPQDVHVVNVLGDGFRVVVEGQQLTLTASGGLGLVYRAES
jgi:heat shock protein HslJ